MHIQAFVSAVFFAFLSILITVGLKSRASADSVCLEQPGSDSPQGEHWYYHYDRESNRKCWHLGPAAAVVHEASLPPRAERTRTLGTAVNAAFSSLFRGLRNLFRKPMPHEATAGEPRIIQSDATRPLTIEDIAQPQPELPEERAEVRSTTLTPARRKALYDEYLKWEELRRNVGGAGPTAPARSP